MEGLYLVTDRKLCGRRSLDDVVLAAAKGGCSCVQLREKDLSTRLFIEEAKRIKKLLAPFSVPLIINDRLDVALAVGADGLHIGQDDIPYDTARKWLGPKAVIGLSVENWADVTRAQDLDVDYIGVSPVFSTPTKTDTKDEWGLEGIKKIKAFTRHCIVAIGGLNLTNTYDAVMAGADCIAVVSAVCAADFPYKAARDLNDLIHRALITRSDISE
ncbi:MAG: thiamine phosphate synthase [Deltaproteobacteria bacterium]|nr:thiamine phosphate synthase [Deltaproteobacteria bacterium]